MKSTTTTSYYVTAIGDRGESLPILITPSWTAAMRRAREQVATEAGNWSQCRHSTGRWEWRSGSRWVAVEQHEED